MNRILRPATFSLLMAIGFLSGVQNHNRHDSDFHRNDPDAYIHVNMLKNKYGHAEIESLIQDAKRACQTAKDLIEIKKIEGDVNMQGNRQKTLGVTVFCCAVVVVFFFTTISVNSDRVKGWIKAWKGTN